MSNFLLYVTYINFNICCLLFIVIASVVLYRLCNSELIDFLYILKSYVTLLAANIRLTILEAIRALDSYDDKII